MRNLIVRLWSDDGGAIIASEFVLVGTILVLGLVVGFRSVNAALNSELGEYADAMGAVSQSYRYCGATSGCAIWHGGVFTDQTTTTGIAPCVSTFDEDGRPIVCGPGGGRP